MGDITPELAALLLIAEGLGHELFKPDEVAADLTARVKLNESLDGLLERVAGADPTAFDPNWHA
jgi:hypothetical protein